MIVALAVGVLTWSPEARATPPGCGESVIDDPLAGATLGDQQGGALDPAGFTPGGSDPPGSIVWALDPPIRAGCFEFTVEGVTTAAVGEHDLLELFTGPNGSFSDRAIDHFLLLKVAGAVFPEYEGRLKVEMGLEYDTLEVGTWADAVAWDPGSSYTLTVRLDGGGVAEFYRDDVLLESVDYNEIAGGDLAFASLRIPNDGQYQVEPPLGSVRLRDVRVFDADPQTGDGTTGGPTDSSGGNVDTGTAGEPETSGAASTGTTGLGTGAGSGTGAGPGSGLPLPSSGGETEGCACRASAPSPAAWLGWLVLVLARRRRSA